MKNFKNITLALIASALFSCSTGKQSTAAQPDKAEAIESTTAVVKDQKAENKKQFWNNLFAEVCKSDNSKNVCISPLSAQLALSMTAAGAIGETQEEMYASMNLTGDVNALSKGIIEKLASSNGKCKVELANSIWANENLAVKEAFANSATKFFDATAENIPFDATAVKRINQWCSDKTNGKINSILKEINKNDRMFLLNALYFKGEWADKFRKEATEEKPFTTENGATVKVQMMHQKIRTTYYEDNLMQMASKPFYGGYEMLLILPTEGVTFEELSTHLATGYEKDSIETDIFGTKNMRGYEVELSMPKFKSEFGTSLRNALEHMGIRRAFSLDAQFDEISNEPLYINDVIQKTFISVDESGAEAAAVTSVSMRLGSTMRPEKRVLNLNRPFLYIIKDYSGNILFVGKVGDPTQE